MACSMPPMYWSTGIQWRAAAGSNGRSVAPGIAEAQEVPGGVDEGVHGVGLAAGRSPADGAGGVQEPLVEGQGRLAGREELDVVGRHDRQLVLGHRHHAVVGAVDGRDGAAPEPLPRDQPVAEPVVDLALADALVLEPVDGAGLGRGDVEPVQEVAVDLLALAGVRPAAVRRPNRAGLHGAHDREAVELGRRPSPARPRPAPP